MCLQRPSESPALSDFTEAVPDQPAHKFLAMEASTVAVSMLTSIEYLLFPSQLMRSVPRSPLTPQQKDFLRRMRSCHSIKSECCESVLVRVIPDPPHASERAVPEPSHTPVRAIPEPASTPERAMQKLL